MSSCEVEMGVFPPEVFLDEEFTLKKVGHAHACMEDNKAVAKVMLTVP
jgi:hypothetical protein